jgi:hypothetical protein
VPLLALGLRLRLRLRIGHGRILPALLHHSFVIKCCRNRWLACLPAPSYTRRCCAALRRCTTRPLARAELHSTRHSHRALPSLWLWLLSGSFWRSPSLLHVVLIASQLPHAAAHHQRLIKHCKGDMIAQEGKTGFEGLAHGCGRSGCMPCSASMLAYNP